MKTRLFGLPVALVAAAVAGAAPTPAATVGSPSAVRTVTAADVQAAFAKGQPLIETDRYKIHASRREKPGQAEIHELDTDIVYVLDGTATLVTGGAAMETRTVAPHEIRGTAIAGGDVRSLVKGDVVVIPHGVPHEFREVRAPFLYYVVKVTDTTGGTR